MKRKKDDPIDEYRKEIISRTQPPAEIIAEIREWLNKMPKGMGSGYGSDIYTHGIWGDQGAWFYFDRAPDDNGDYKCRVHLKDFNRREEWEGFGETMLEAAMNATPVEFEGEEQWGKERSRERELAHKRKELESTISQIEGRH